MRSCHLGSTRLALVICLGVSALAIVAPVAAAQRVELAGRVTASRTVLSQRRVGEPRYIAISDLFYRDRSAYLEVLDLETQTVVQVKAKRSLLERRFGVARGGAMVVPQGEIAVFREGVVGVALTEGAIGTSRRTWYVELDAGTGKLVRNAGLATISDGEQLQIVGADPVSNAVWFAITRLELHGRTVVLRRLDLASLEVRDAQRIALTARGPRGREHAVAVHAASDFSRFAVVEYVEDGVQMAPGQVVIADPVAGTVFAVPAPPTSYGVAFSLDGKYVYLGSAQRGTISRIDIAAGRIDKQVAAPRNLHHLIVSPTGAKLFVFATSNTYAAYDLPDLRARNDATHPPGVAPAMIELHGDGIASLDGAYFVVPDVEDRRKPAAPDRAYIIARLIE
jgi:hypothetical protein